MPLLTAAERSLELQRTETTIYHLTGRSTRPYARPPYGDLDARAPVDLGAAGYSAIILSTVDTQAWQTLSAADVAGRALAAAEPGAIYELHTGAGSPDAAVVGQLIDSLRGQGYAFGSITDIVAP
jgi:peptidoglycan/xylan/chitin deacetylase (PgdA/CDA1 family)